MVELRKKSSYHDPSLWRAIRKRVPITAWPFLIAMLAFIFGISGPALWWLAVTGGFVMFLYLVIWITWVMFQAQHPQIFRQAIPK